jgi:hypothetical protein
LGTTGTPQFGSNVGMGIAPVSTDGLKLYPTLSGASTQQGLNSTPTFGSDCTLAGYGLKFSGATAAASFTLPNLYSCAVLDAAKGSGSTISNLVGFYCGDLTQGGNNFGFQGQVTSGAAKWNLYMAGTAQNFLQGNLGINVLSPLARLHVVDTTEPIRFGYSANEYMRVLVLQETTTIAAAATTDSTLNLPANAIILGVTVNVTVAIPTASTFTVTGATSGTTFNTAAVSTALNSTDVGTKAGAFYNSASQKVRFTPNSTPANNNGRVKVTVYYILPVT